MNTVVTSREAILEVSRQLIRRQGWAGVSIRALASACGVSVGSIYNYFDSKAALMAATVESVWQDVFHFSAGAAGYDSFLSCVQWLFDSLAKGAEKYPGFFTLHSMSFLGEDDRSEGQQVMARSWAHIQNALLAVLLNDKAIRPEAFDAQLRPEDFSQLVFSLMLSALLRQDYDCRAILEMIKRTIY